ncbi:MAG: hypothetical protein AB7O62_14535 [Pirellulales bacterium]
MRVLLSDWHATESCTWCEKQRECVTVSFEDGFLNAATLCWNCLQKAVKVRNRQDGGQSAAAASASNGPRPAESV